MTYTIDRILQFRLAGHPKSLLLLGPRQVGKSTLCLALEPDLVVNLADEETFRQHLNDPGLIRRIVDALHGKGWRISSYRDAMGVEVDLVIETGAECIAVEFKSSTRVYEKMFRGLVRFEQIARRKIKRYLVYQGEFEQRFEHLGLAVPYRKFLDAVVPALS